MAASILLLAAAASTNKPPGLIGNPSLSLGAQSERWNFSDHLVPLSFGDGRLDAVFAAPMGCENCERDLIALLKDLEARGRAQHLDVAFFPLARDLGEVQSAASLLCAWPRHKSPASDAVLLALNVRNPAPMTDCEKEAMESSFDAIPRFAMAFGVGITSAMIVEGASGKVYRIGNTALAGPALGLTRF